MLVRGICNKFRTRTISMSTSERKRALPTSLSTHVGGGSTRRKMTTIQTHHDGDSQLRQQEQSGKAYRPLVIVLAGPTAVGKSDVAAELCSPALSSDISRGHASLFDRDARNKSHHNSGDEAGRKGAAAARGHVISADSVQAYRGVNIGANKPTPAEMERTPHHLVNVVDPPTDPSKASSYNAADWMKDASYVVRELASFNNDNGACMASARDVDDDTDRDGSGDETERNKEALLRRESIEKALRQSLQLVPGSEDNGSEQTALHAATNRQTILPVVVGGTMMYLQWLVHGRPDAIRPTEAAVERAANKINEYQTETQEDSKIDGKANGSRVESSGIMNGTMVDMTNNGGDSSEDVATWNAASTYVSSLGPLFAKRVEKLPGRDWYRLRRLLEVAYTVASERSNAATKEQIAENGSSVTSEQEILQSLTEKEVYTGMRSGSLLDLGYDVRCFFLCPDQRMRHFHTVDERCEQMLLRGLLRETAALHDGGGLPAGSQVTRAIGYRQALDYLQRKGAKQRDGAALAAFLNVFAAATRQYAKKQMQWFRRDGKFAFIPVQMEGEKGQRVANAANMIADMCKLCTSDFEAELDTNRYAQGSDPKNGNGDGGLLPLSAQTKLDNERQGKDMKFFQSKRVHLIDGSDDFLKVLAEADECTRRVQGLGEEFAVVCPARC